MTIYGSVSFAAHLQLSTPKELELTDGQLKARSLGGHR